MNIQKIFLTFGLLFLSAQTYGMNVDVKAMEKHAKETSVFLSQASIARHIRTTIQARKKDGECTIMLINRLDKQTYLNAVAEVQAELAKAQDTSIEVMLDLSNTRIFIRPKK